MKIMWLRLWVIGLVIATELSFANGRNNVPPEGDGFVTVTHKPAKRKHSSDYYEHAQDPRTTTTQRSYVGAKRQNTGLHRANSGPREDLKPKIVSDESFFAFTDELFRADIPDSLANDYTVSYDFKNFARDIKLQLPNTADVQKKLDSKLYQELLKLKNFFNSNLTIQDTVGPAKDSAITNYMKIVFQSPVWSVFFKYLKDTGIDVEGIQTKEQLQKYVKKIWFTTFYRPPVKRNPNAPDSPKPKRKIQGNNACGFEHVFFGDVGEDDSVSGLHNGFVLHDQREQYQIMEQKSYSYKDEVTGQLFGVLKQWIVGFGQSRKLSTVMLGPSPALEMAYSTACFIFRRELPCILKVGGKFLHVSVHPWPRYGNPIGISSAYAEIDNTFNKPEDNETPQSTRTRSHSFNGRSNNNQQQYPTPRRQNSYSSRTQNPSRQNSGSGTTKAPWQNNVGSSTTTSSSRPPYRSLG